MQSKTRITIGLLLTGLGLTEQALATVDAGGGSRILGTDFLIELFTVATSVWIPVILGLTGVGVLVGLAAKITEVNRYLHALRHHRYEEE